MSTGNAAVDAPSKPFKTYNGGCHCGAVRFAVSTPSLEAGAPVTSCNCSICTKQGLLLVYPLRTEVAWLQGGEEQLLGYAFAGKRIQHLFCGVCGTSVGARSGAKGFFEDRYAINIRTFDDVDEIVDKLTLNKMDGKAREPAYRS